MPKTKSTKKPKQKKHKRIVIKRLSDKLNATGSSETVSEEVILEVSKLPQLELNPERKCCWEIVTKDHRHTMEDSIYCFSKKYLECQGKSKHPYVDLQLGWHDFLRSVASAVERQHYFDAQVVDVGHQVAISSPMFRTYMVPAGICLSPSSFEGDTVCYVS